MCTGRGGAVGRHYFTAMFSSCWLTQIVDSLSVKCTSQFAPSGSSTLGAFHFPFLVNIPPCLFVVHLCVCGGGASLSHTLLLLGHSIKW